MTSEHQSKKSIIVISLWVILLFSAVLVVSTSHHIRTATNQHHLLSQEFNLLIQQKNHLIMELNTFGGYVRLEELANNQYAMKNVVTQPVEQVVYE